MTKSNKATPNQESAAFFWPRFLSLPAKIAATGADKQKESQTTR